MVSIGDIFPAIRREETDTRNRVAAFLRVYTCRRVDRRRVTAGAYANLH